MMSLRQHVLAPARGEQAMRSDGGSAKPRGIRLLMSSLVSLSGGRLSAGVLGLGLPSRDLALCGRLVLLGASFGFECFITRHGASSFLDFALDVLRDTFDSGLGARFVRHGCPPIIIRRSGTAFPASVADKLAPP